jgi:F0F1-type ATP synthase alpha subunit
MAVSKSTKEAVVIDLFLNQKDNRVEAISIKTGLDEQTVKGVINKYLGDLKLKHEEI